MPVEIVGLVSGLIGAVIGVGGAFLIYTRERAEAKAMACRAVYIELGYNATIVEKRTKLRLSTAAWDSQFPLVLASLGLKDGVDVSAAYVLLPALEDDPSDSETRQTVLELLHAAIVIVHKKVPDAPPLSLRTG